MSLEDMPRDSVSPIASRAEFQAAVRAALAQAADAGAREVCLLDPNFADWPLGERGVVETLARWVDSRRMLTVMAADFDALARGHVRFVEWRRQWAHVVRCRQDEELEAEDIPTLLFVPGLVSVRLLDRARHRGTVSTRSVDQVAARELVDALL